MACIDRWLSEEHSKGLKIEHGFILEIEKTKNGLLKPYSPVTRMKGSARGVFREPIDCQRNLPKEWKTSYDLVKT